MRFFFFFFSLWLKARNEHERTNTFKSVCLHVAWRQRFQIDTGVDREISPQVYTTDMFPYQSQHGTRVFTYWAYCIHSLQPVNSGRSSTCKRTISPILGYEAIYSLVFFFKSADQSRLDALRCDYCGHLQNVVDIYRAFFCASETSPVVKPQLTETLAEVSENKRSLCSRVHLQVSLLFAQIREMDKTSSGWF